MSLATRPPRPATRPDRLPRSAAADRGHEIRLGLAGVAGLVLLVAGIPAALVIFVGYPLPRSAPSHDWLTQTITATLIIKILACVVWLVWAHFAVCLISEWRALRRGRLPRTVPLGGGSQLLARRLVAAALLLGGAATATFPHGGGHVAAPPAAVASQHAGGTVAGVPAWQGVSPADQLAAAAHDAGGEADTPAAAHKYYVVRPPHGRRYDSLWDIAERTLKDPLRYKEIFALNKDRVQSDGSKLVDANLIRPGWELRLPADASGPGVRELQPNVPAPHQDAAATPSAADQAPVEQVPLLPAQADAAPVTHSAASVPSLATARPASATPDTSLESITLGGGLMLAGLLVALTARRGPYAPAGADEQALALSADAGLAATLDRALRLLAAARADQGRALPQPVVAWASPEQVTLNLAGGDTAEPPAPWQSAAEGWSWTCRLAELPEHPRLAETSAPFPGLLSVGRHETYEVFVDFEQAPGLVSLCGDVERGRELATALAVQAATSVWSDGARVSVVGFGDGADVARIQPRAITETAHLADLLDELEQEHEAVQRLQRQLGVDGVLTGRQARRDQAWRPHVLVLSGPPTPDETRRLQLLVGSGRSNVIVLVVGDTAGARWRFTLDASGGLDLGILGASAQAHRLPRAGAARLAELAASAEAGRRAESGAVAALTPQQAAAREEALRAVPPVPSGPATVAVQLLGPVSVTAPGPIDPAKRELATEIVVAIAVQPDGLHDAVLRASIWPRGVSDDVSAAALADVAAWLGTDPSGRPALIDDGGRWRLGDCVRVDLDELRRLAATATGPDELAALQQAIALFHGEAFSATPAERYRWLAFARSAREANVVGTAVTRRAAALLADQQRTADAEEVLRRGLQLTPTAEPLWRDLLALAGRRGPEPAAAVAADLYRTLREHRAWPEPETDALVAQLAPGSAAAQTA
ncbi:MAG TPA: hypothetical protein VFT67_10045 [Jatrophihabitantaceae bacterium]|nr:hypothetical protein [Jatrophihabitantaceae bacterium]